MKIYVFGNSDEIEDKKALVVTKKLKKHYPQIDFIEVKPNQDLPFDNQEQIIIMDVVVGLNQVELINDGHFPNLVTNSSTSVHDFDLGFQLKYLKKLGKLGKVTIVGLPAGKTIDYLRIHSIFKKFVAQDMHGS